MSNAKRVNWMTKKNLLTRENLNKMSEDIHASVSMSDFDESRRIAHDSFSRKQTLISDTNTLYVPGGTRAEVYLHHDGCYSLFGVFDKTSDPRFGMSGQFVPVPPGTYRMRIDNGNEIYQDGFDYVITRFRNRAEKDPSDTDNVEIVASGSIASGGSFAEVELPNGADYFYVKKYTGAWVGCKLRVYKADGSVPVASSVRVLSAANLMPFPYHIEYA